MFAGLHGAALEAKIGSHCTSLKLLSLEASLEVPPGRPTSRSARLAGKHVSTGLCGLFFFFNNETKLSRLKELKYSTSMLSQKLQRKRKELKRERQAAAAKAEFEPVKEEPEDKLEHTQRLLQGQWSTRYEERKTKQPREE